MNSYLTAERIYGIRAERRACRPDYAMLPWLHEIFVLAVRFHSERGRARPGHLRASKLRPRDGDAGKDSHWHVGG